MELIYFENGLKSRKEMRALSLMYGQIMKA